MINFTREGKKKITIIIFFKALTGDAIVKSKEIIQHSVPMVQRFMWEE